MRLFIGNLAYQARERDVEKFFKGFEPREVILKNGFGFVDIEDARDAEDAVHDLNGKEFMGQRVIVDFTKGRGPRGPGGVLESERGGGGGYDRGGRGGGGPRPQWVEKYGPPNMTDYRVIVENLSSRVSWQDLKDFMRKAGDVTFAEAHKTRGEGMVCFATRSDMKRAMEKLDGEELQGKRLKIVEDTDRRGGGGAAGARSRSRSRSPRRRRTRSRSPPPRRPTRSASRSHSRSKSSRSRSPV